ncbi:unnamed protein product, partial [Prorocentrum cordatum]
GGLPIPESARFQRSPGYPDPMLGGAQCVLPDARQSPPSSSCSPPGPACGRTAACGGSCAGCRARCEPGVWVCQARRPPERRRRSAALRVVWSGSWTAHLRGPLWWRHHSAHWQWHRER